MKFVKISIAAGISPEAKAMFSELINDFSDLFPKNEKDNCSCDVTAHKKQIETGPRPVKLPNRRIPLLYKEDLKENIDAFLEKKCIATGDRPYSAPAMLVPKINCKLRLIFDRRQLTNQSNKFRWPIPSKEKTFGTLEGR